MAESMKNLLGGLLNLTTRGRTSNQDQQSVPHYQPGRRVFIAAHRPYPMPSSEGYIPIHAGKAISTVDLGFAGDDTGDHISDRNPFFCELTVLYWLWKNTNWEQVGLMHYRRYLSGMNRFESINNTQFAACDDFTELDGDYDIVLPQPQKLTHYNTAVAKTVEQGYDEWHYVADLLSARNTIALLHGDYVDAFDMVMRSSTMSGNNVFVGKKYLIDKYCEWLFSIFFHMENQSSHRSYQGYNRRMFGYLSERLFNVWLVKHWNEMRIAYRTLLQVDA